MSQMVTPVQVKKMYRKACLAIHPDKVSLSVSLSVCLSVRLDELFIEFPVHSIPL